MKNHFIVVICLCAILFSCSRVPEQYKRGIAEKAKKNYESAIKSFLLVPAEEKEYKDSAANQVAFCIDSLAAGNCWDLINKQLKFIQLDSLAFDASRKGIVGILDDIVKKGNWKKVLFALDTLDKDIIKPDLVKKIRYSAEDLALQGTWTGIGLVKSKIEFERNDSISNGVCVENKSGWEEGSIIYKNVRYERNGIWDVQPKIFNFNINYGYSMGAYHSKKYGRIKFIGLDTIEINYEIDLYTGPNRLKFVRDKAGNQVKVDDEEKINIGENKIFSGCWQGPYANNKRTVVICITSLNGSEVSGYDKLILPSGKEMPETYFKGTISKSASDNKITLRLYESGEGKIGIFEIIFDASNPVEGKGFWKSNDGKLVRDLTISRKQENL